MRKWFQKVRHSGIWLLPACTNKIKESIVEEFYFYHDKAIFDGREDSKRKKMQQLVLKIASRYQGW